MTDKELAALIDHVNEVVAVIAGDSKENRRMIERYIKSTRLESAISWGALDNLNVVNLLAQQLRLQIAMVEVLQEIKHRLPEPPVSR